MSKSYFELSTSKAALLPTLNNNKVLKEHALWFATGNSSNESAALLLENCINQRI